MHAYIIMIYSVAEKKDFVHAKLWLLLGLDILHMGTSTAPILTASIFTIQCGRCIDIKMELDKYVMWPGGAPSNYKRLH